MKQFRRLIGLLPGMALFLLMHPANAQLPTAAAQAEALNRFKGLQQELSAASYPMDYDKFLLLVHRHTRADPSFGSMPPPGSDKPSFSFLMLDDMEAAFLEDYLIEVVYKGSAPQAARVIRARLCLRSKSGPVFYLDDREPTYFPNPVARFPLSPANHSN